MIVIVCVLIFIILHVQWLLRRVLSFANAISFFFEICTSERKVYDIYTYVLVSEFTIV